MRTIHRFHTLVLVIATVFAMTIIAPIAAHAEEQILVMAPAGSSWEEESGYQSVEASRAAASSLRAPVAAPTWDEASGYGAVEASRAMAAQSIVENEASDDALVAKRAELFAQFRLIELGLSQHLGAEQPGTATCGDGV